LDVSCPAKAVMLQPQQAAQQWARQQQVQQWAQQQQQQLQQQAGTRAHAGPAPGQPGGPLVQAAGQARPAEQQAQHQGQRQPSSLGLGPMPSGPLLSLGDLPDSSGGLSLFDV
jgi:hypothetical protein